MMCDLMSSVFLSSAILSEEGWPDTVDLASSPSPIAPINEAHIGLKCAMSMSNHWLFWVAA